MGQTLTQIAEQLRGADKKVQLIYAFNGSGKTRLSREFKELIDPKTDEFEDAHPAKVLYYNAFTEDLFYWDNDLENDAEPKLVIQPNTFTEWVLLEQGQDQNVVKNFQCLTNENLTPSFNQHYRVIDGKRVHYIRDVTFSVKTGDKDGSGDIKIAKGEESNFVWSVFFTLLEQVIAVLDVSERTDRETDLFNALEYVFIDDPVSSLDENHLIELAVNLAAIIKSSQSPNLRFIVTTHNPLFYNILHNEFGIKDRSSSFRPRDAKKYLLSKTPDTAFELEEQPNDSPFSYHLLLLEELRMAIDSGEIKKYHFNFLRNVLEKTATFLGYRKWGDLLPQTNKGTSDPYAARIINLCSHSAHSGEEIASLEDDDKRVLGFLVRHLVKKYSFNSQGPTEDA